MLFNLKIFIDQSVILPDNFIEKYNLGIIPIRIMDERGEEWTGKKREEIIKGLKEGHVFKTSVMSPGKILKILEKYNDKEIISFHVSSELSGVVSVMNVVKKKFRNITVVDTKTAGPCSGMGVLAGLKAIEEGCSKEEIIKRTLEVALNSIVFMAVPETLRLARIRPVEGLKKFIEDPSIFIKFLRTPFGFPIITIEGNKLRVFDFSRSFENSCKKMIEGAADYVKGKKGKLFSFIFFSEKNEMIENFKEEIVSKYNPFKIYEGHVGEVPLAAIGLNAFGVAFYKGEIELV